MCGRFANAIPPQILMDFFALPETPTIPLHWNIAPSQTVPAIKSAGEETRQLTMARWGLIPHWAKDTTIGNRLINARSETVHEKPAFRKAFRARRCLVPASGFYEWAKTASKRVPYYISMKDGVPMALAGIWDSWDTPEGEVLESFSILTTAANRLLQPIHDRMPVICQPADFTLWLDQSVTDPAKLRPLLQPCPAEILQSWPVSTLVNNPRHDSAECIQPVTKA
ncbi:SOS response-associated peptidase [Desulfurivibrio sp. C05AmB]|uniref:SOS response-associated peptidase n=1 Tax=Desulfurivibrio sp. C05AmB TaxID=3374371 RepID=UPI00376EBE63